MLYEIYTEEILKVHAKKVKMAKEVDLSVIAKSTPGFVGADLANVINEAAILAARQDKPAVTNSDIEEAVERVMAGPQRKSRVISEKEKRIIAAHESGHTLIAKLSKNGDPVHKVSMIPRGPALGYTMQLPLEDKYLTSKSEILDKLTILLGGRAAEEILFEEITTGASDDLSRATSYARKMVAQLGMSDRLGPIAVQTEEDEVFLGRDISRHKNISEDLARAIDEEVSKLVRDSYQKAKDIIKDHLKEMHTLIDRLLEKEVVDAKEIDEILGLAPAEEVKTEEKKEEIKPVAEPIKAEPKAEPKTKPAKTKQNEPADDLFGGQDA